MTLLISNFLILLSGNVLWFFVLLVQESFEDFKGSFSAFWLKKSFEETLMVFFSCVVVQESFEEMLRVFFLRFGSINF